MDQYADILTYEDSFRYQLLSRMKSDCEYYLNFGGRSPNALWAKDEADQIMVMKALWESFGDSDKPEWLAWDDILQYESQMTQQN